MHHPRCFKLFLVVCTRGSDVVDREEVGQNEMRTCQLGREVVGQCIYRGTVDGVEDKEEGGLLVVASQFVLFLLRLRQTICRYWDCAVIVIV